MSSSISLFEVSLDLSEGILTLMFIHSSSLCDSVALVVGFLFNLLAQFVIVNLMAIFTFHVSAKLLHQFLLQFAHRFDSISSSLQCTEEILFRNLFHLTFDHHDIVFCGTYHDIHISLFKLFESRINHIFPVNAGNTYFRNRAFKRNI